MAGTLVLLRHGQSEWNAKNLFTGWVDVELTAKGEEEAGLTVSGDFDAGDFVDVTFTFDNDESVSLEIPVMKPCHQYEGLDNTQKNVETEALYTCAEGHAEAPAEH